MKRFEKLPLSFQAILRFLAVAFVLNIAALATMAYFSETKPVSDVHLTARRDGILIFGKNRMGSLCVKVFPHWDAAMAFLKENQLEIPVIRHAYRGQGAIVSAFPNDDRQSYRIVWSGEDNKGVLFTPDSQSAKILADIVRYSELSPSPYGFSLALN